MDTREITEEEPPEEAEKLRESGSEKRRNTMQKLCRARIWFHCDARKIN